LKLAFSKTENHENSQSAKKKTWFLVWWKIFPYGTGPKKSRIFQNLLNNHLHTSTFKYRDILDLICSRNTFQSTY
jgi:hypothetical protein